MSSSVDDTKRLIAIAQAAQQGIDILTVAEQLQRDAYRCKALGVAFNPKLPRNFDDTPNEARPASHRRWWNRPFIITGNVDDCDRFYAERTDEFADAERARWAATGRAKWLKAWPSGISYSVRCLDGGAWDRSTSWGDFATLEEALLCTGLGYSWPWAHAALAERTGQART